MSLNHTNEESKKLSDSQDLKDNNNKEESTEKNNETTITKTAKSNAFDLTKSDNTPTEIIDILDEPDVAVWSKGIMNKTIPLPTKFKNLLTLSQ